MDLLLSATLGGNPSAAPGPYVVDLNGAPFKAALAEAGLGHPYGSGQCAAVRNLAGAPPTGQWIRGDPVRGNVGLTPGTLIANFQGPGNTYSSAPPWSHTAIYVGQDDSGLIVYDQWTMGVSQPHVLSKRTLRFGGRGPANNGDLFYVIK